MDKIGPSLAPDILERDIYFTRTFHHHAKQYGRLDMDILVSLPKCALCGNIPVPKCPSANMSQCQNVPMPKYPSAEMSLCRNYLVPKSPSAEKSPCWNVHGDKIFMCRNVHEPKSTHAEKFQWWNVLAKMSLAEMSGVEISPICFQAKWAKLAVVIYSAIFII